MQADDIHHRFAYHAPTGNKGALHEDARLRCETLAHLVNELVPDSREKSTAISKLEEAMMWANAGIARHAEVKVAG